MGHFNFLDKERLNAKVIYRFINNKNELSLAKKSEKDLPIETHLFL